MKSKWDHAIEESIHEQTDSHHCFLSKQYQFIPKQLSHLFPYYPPMKLKSLQPRNWGPFSYQTEINFEEDVTVLTGANDTGKSCILDLLSAVLRWPNKNEMSKVVQEKHWNYYRSDSHQNITWESDPDFNCTGFFDPSESLIKKLLIEPNHHIKIDFSLAQNELGNAKAYIVHSERSIYTDVGSPESKFILPHPIGLPIDSSGWNINSIIHSQGGSHNDILTKEAIFQGQNTLSRLNNQNRVQVRIKANRLIENYYSRLTQLFPKSMHTKIDFRTDGDSILLSVIDHDLRETPISMRGSGIRSFFNLFPSFAIALSMEKQILLWIDEPESSLHYDMQHKLRAFLEEIGSNPLIQVVYATHSPAMINNGRPRSLRIVKHISNDSNVYSTVLNDFDIDNYGHIRSLLGITPSDSLLLSTVNIIVEGKTESNFLPLIFEKLENDKNPDFLDWSTICPECSILDAKGDTWIKYTRWVHSQNLLVLCVIDGDKKIPQDIQIEFNTKNIKILQIPFNQDVEWLLADGIYFEGVVQYLDLYELNEDNLTGQQLEARFNDWSLQQPSEATKGFDNWAFGKRVFEWVKQNFPGELEKATVFRLALEASQPNKRIKPDGVEFLKKVLSTIRELLDSTVAQ